MNIENLIENMTIKNYKELCKLLNESIKTGNAKKSQLNEFKRYFKYHKQGHKFIIDTIYNIPLAKELKIGNSKYIQEIQDILTYYIYKNRNKDGKLILSFSKLIEVLGFANKTYTISNVRKKELSDILNIELAAIYYFYNNSRCEFKRIIKRALNNLKKKKCNFL